MRIKSIIIDDNFLSYSSVADVSESFVVVAVGVVIVAVVVVVVVIVIVVVAVAVAVVVVDVVAMFQRLDTRWCHGVATPKQKLIFLVADFMNRGRGDQG